MYENIKIEKIKDCMAESQADIYIYNEEIEKHSDKLNNINKIGFCLIYSIIVIGVIIFSKNTIIFISMILSTIPIILLFVLYNRFISKKVI